MSRLKHGISAIAIEHRKENKLKCFFLTQNSVVPLVFI